MVAVGLLRGYKLTSPHPQICGETERAFDWPCQDLHGQPDANSWSDVDRSSQKADLDLLRKAPGFGHAVGVRGRLEAITKENVQLDTWKQKSGSERPYTGRYYPPL